MINSFFQIVRTIYKRPKMSRLFKLNELELIFAQQFNMECVNNEFKILFIGLETATETTINQQNLNNKFRKYMCFKNKNF